MRTVLLLWVFVLSGFSGLIYQSIWTQYLGLFLGHSSYAQSLVLILFMGGMAGGAWIASRYTEAVSRPLAAYAGIEMLIGVLGLSFNALYVTGTTFAYEHLLPGLGSSEMVTVARWLLSAALILPACLLLGATFPLMSAGFIRLQPQSGGKVLAGLYFTNSIGAAAGALAATYILLPRVGLPGAVMTAGILNILVALLIYPMGKQPHPAGHAVADSSKRTYSQAHALIAIAAITGATSFIYEIVWVRMLSLAVGTTLHAFELMLAAFIAGIAFGGLWLRNRADNLPSPILAAGWAQILMGLAALLSLLVYANAFEWVQWLMRALDNTSSGYAAYNISTGIIAMLVMFPAAFFAGMTLPLLTLALLRTGHGERAIGRVYAANTLGAIAGVLVALHALMPVLGVKWAIWLAAAADITLGAWLFTIAKKGAIRRGAAHIPAVAVALCIVLAAFSFVRFDPMMLASSVYRTGSSALRADSDVLYYKDGKTASIAVYESGPSDARGYSIATNGKVDAGLAKDANSEPRPDEYTMALLAALPLAIKQDDVSNVGIVGFGSGMTTHFILGSKRVDQVDTVEIEPAMVEGARLFADRVYRAFNDKRSKVIIDDAKSYFSASGKKYDVIISEPSNPWMGGTATLFTEEFYRFIPQHLSENGIFVQWLQLYEIDLPLVSSVLRAMLPNFADVSAFLANEGDLILIASPSGPVPRPSDFPIGDSELAEELSRIGAGTARELNDGFVLNGPGLRSLAELVDAPTNSDFFPHLQLAAPERRFLRSNVRVFGDIATAPWPIASLLGGFEVRRVTEPLPGVIRDINLDRKLRAAREIRTALMHGGAIPAEFASREDTLQAYALRGLAQACQLDDAPRQTAHMMISLAMETVTFLAPDDQIGLWSDADWITCPPQDPLVVRVLELIAATSQGDDARVIRVGSQLLDGPTGDSILGNPDAAYFVRGALQFAALRSGSRETALALAEKYDGRLSDEVRTQPLLVLLNQLSARPPMPGLVDRAAPD